MGNTYYELAWIFFFYSFLGWCTGVAVGAVKRKTFANRGLLNLPLCPAYGITAVSFSVFLFELRDNVFFLFLGGMVISAFWIIVTGFVLERIFRKKWWDFSQYRFQFEGYLTVGLLLVCGAAAVAVMRFLNPVFLRLLHLLPNSIGRIALAALFGALLLDLFIVIAVTLRWRKYLERLEGVTQNMQMVSEKVGNAITRMVRRRLERSYPELKTEMILKARAARKPVEKVRFAQGCCFYKLAWLFFIGALLGDLVETVFCRITMGYWMSRSSLVYGPFSIIWGFACALLTVFLYRYRERNDRYIFFMGTILGGAYEYICSVIGELVFGAIFWDYSGIPFNLGGRINLLYCFFWGIAAVIWLKGVYPFLSRLIEKIPKKVGPVITWLMVILMSANMAISGLAFMRYSDRTKGDEPDNALEVFLGEHFPDERIEKVYPKAKVVEPEKPLRQEGLQE